MSRHGRSALVLLAFLLLAGFALPIAAQPARQPEARDSSHLLAAVWSRLLAPFAALWGADDSRGIWDPNGQRVTATATDPGTMDGRGVWDPNG